MTEKPEKTQEEIDAEDPMIEPDADHLDTEVEDADLFLGDGDEDEEKDKS
jgi:hypothetical protein